MLPSIFSENLFDDFFNSAMFPKAEHELYGKHAKNLMNTDVREVENGYEIDMNLPGFKKDEVEIQLQNGCLTVSAAKGLDKDEEDKKPLYPSGALRRFSQPQLLCGRGCGASGCEGQV